MTPREALLVRGWHHFPRDPALSRWVAAVRDTALGASSDPGLRNEWLRLGGTWFVGVNALPNDAAGRVGNGPPLPGEAIALTRELYGTLPLDRAQVSVVYPGYPGPDGSEGEAAHRFRLTRDAAHIDGMKLFDDGKRHLGERHAYILGLPLGTSRGAPLVVWDGSHTVMRRAFDRALRGIEPSAWEGVDLTEAYHAARREVFETCQRRTLPAGPGEATLLHRLALHGVAPWGDSGETEPRAILYFRPDLPGCPSAWLDAP